MDTYIIETNNERIEIFADKIEEYENILYFYLRDPVYSHSLKTVAAFKNLDYYFIYNGKK